MKVPVNSIRRRQRHRVQRQALGGAQGAAHQPGQGAARSSPSRPRRCARATSCRNASARARPSSTSTSTSASGTYLFKDDNGFTFMDKENYEQLTVGADVSRSRPSRALAAGTAWKSRSRSMRGTAGRRRAAQEAWCWPSSRPTPWSRARLPPRPTSRPSSKAAIRVMVPPHIGVGTKLVINTEDGSYMERSKD